MFHHVERGQRTINNNEIGWWQYSAFNLPPAVAFTKEIKYTFNENTEIKAEARWNLHGSSGPEFFKVIVKE
jgi:hypothetical protein